MAYKWFFSLWLLSLINGCAMPPTASAPCRNFGKFCMQQPINKGPHDGFTQL